MRISKRLCLTTLCLTIGCSSSFLLPLPGRHGAHTQVWSAVSERPAAVASTSTSSTEMVAPVLPGMAEEEADDPNEYYEQEPVDPTVDELKALCAEEMAHVLPDGKTTVQQWLETEKPTFSDGSLVIDWIKEAQRLRLLPFLERAEHLKALSFDDLNLFRGRQVEWREMLEAKGVLEGYQGMAETGVTELSEADYEAKLEKARGQYTMEMVEQEEALLKTVDMLCSNARFEGTAADNKVRVVMNGRMEPISVEVKDGAPLGDARLLGQAVEAAMEAAFKLSSDFFEETMATEYLAQASTPTDVQGIVEALARKEFAIDEDVVDEKQL